MTNDTGMEADRADVISALVIPRFVDFDDQIESFLSQGVCRLTFHHDSRSVVWSISCAWLMRPEKCSWEKVM